MFKLSLVLNTYTLHYKPSRQSKFQKTLKLKVLFPF